jgi:hypothetical protein
MIVALIVLLGGCVPRGLFKVRIPKVAPKRPPVHLTPPSKVILPPHMRAGQKPSYWKQGEEGLPERVPHSAHVPHFHFHHVPVHKGQGNEDEERRKRSRLNGRDQKEIEELVNRLHARPLLPPPKGDDLQRPGLPVKD